MELNENTIEMIAEKAIFILKDRYELTPKGNSPQKKKKAKKPSYESKKLVEIKKEDLPEDIQKYYEIAYGFWLLFKEIREKRGIKPTTLLKASGKWIIDVKLMMNRDGRSRDDFLKVYRFLAEDRFWQVNLGSMSKLRKQFEKLLLKINE